MQILIINGSPKGRYSITLQTCLYLEQCFPEHTYTVIEAGAEINRFKRDFTPAMEAIEKADFILFSYPVYTFLAPSQLHQFIELMKTHPMRLKGKYAAQITTSKHFYDITAHEYIRENCADLGLTYLDGLSADMEDLTKKKGQKQAYDFFSHLLFEIGKRQGICDIEPGKDKKIALVCDLAQEDAALERMILLFQKGCPYEIDLINIHEFKFQGGCLGCFRCAKNGKCFYTDGFEELLRGRVQKADAIVIAFSIKDHSMGVPFKLYDDRQFCNGHRTVTRGVPFGYLVHGALSKEHNLSRLIEARAQVGGNPLAAVATDEGDVKAAIENLILQLVYCIEKSYAQPSNFYGVGGMKIFRDLIWQMRGMMRADHKFYKKEKQYDFPQKHRMKMLLMYPIGTMMTNKKLRKKLGNKINEGMIAPYQKVLEKTREEKEKENGKIS